ncbi:MAG: hypothetical protein BYD32DRAFT_118273 [Podila humilis]|nr:MAG: hypothetical protein BYD32DRAFT_118273 [Podila humilis]
MTRTDQCQHGHLQERRVHSDVALGAPTSPPTLHRLTLDPIHERDVVFVLDGWVDGNGPLPFCHTPTIGKTLCTHTRGMMHLGGTFLLLPFFPLGLCCLCFVFCDHLDGWETEREGRGHTARGCGEMQPNTRNEGKEGNGRVGKSGCESCLQRR